MECTNISARIKSLKTFAKNKDITYDQIACLSNIPISTIKKIFSGTTKTPRIDTVEAIERALGFSQPLLTLSGEVELNDIFAIPLLGKVVAGIPLESQENLEGYIYVSYRPTEEYFALRVDGDSMKNAGIFNKSVVVCHKQETAESGDIVVVMLNGEQTVKRFKQVGTSIFLMPENSDFDPIPVTETDSLIILGKVVEVRVMF